MNGQTNDLDTDPMRRRPRHPRLGPGNSGDRRADTWQKDILWTVITEGVVDRFDLLARAGGREAAYVDGVIEGMLAKGFIEAVEGFLRLHPDFSENCYAVIRG
jgi:hypothetical protein